MKKNSFHQVKALMCFILFSVLSCQKDKTTENVQEDTPLLKSDDFEQLIADRTRLAKALSIAINDADFHRFLSQKCIESKLGDAEVLFTDIANVKIPDKDTTVAAFLASLELKGRSSEEEEFYSKHIVEKDPLLTIVLLPGKDKDRSTLVNNNNAKKVYVDKVIDDFKDGESITYSLSGKNYSETYRYSEEPVDVYFAIKLNEEYIAFDRKNEVVIYNAPKTLKDAGTYIDYNYVKSDQALIKRVGNIVIAKKHKEIVKSNLQQNLETRTTCGLECERDCFNGKDALTRIKFAHDYEGWPRGGPEFLMQFALGLNNNVTINSQGYSLSNSNAISYNFGTKKNYWYESDRNGLSLRQIQLLTWTPPQHSRDMMQHWSEDDGSFINMTLGVNLTAKFKVDGVDQTAGLTFSWSFQRGDDNIGSAIVQYCDGNQWYINYYGYEYIVSGPSGAITFGQLDRGF
jgi:hypothetical protein